MCKSNARGWGKNAAADDSSYKLGYFQFFQMEPRDGKNASHSYPPSPFANVRYYDWGLTSIWGKRDKNMHISKNEITKLGRNGRWIFATQFPYHNQKLDRHKLRTTQRNANTTAPEMYWFICSSFDLRVANILLFSSAYVRTCVLYKIYDSSLIKSNTDTHTHTYTIKHIHHTHFISLSSH